MSWSDVNPAKHRLDLDKVWEVVAGLLPDWVEDEDGLYQIQDDLSRELMGNFGVWIQGWCSTAAWVSPLPAWGEWQPQHALDQPPPLVLPILQAVRHWQEFLLAVSAAMPAEISSSLSADVEAAALRLLPVVLNCSHAEDPWYVTFERVLGWYLEARGLDPERHGQVVREVVRGRFSSWVDPLPAERAEVCADLGRRVMETEQSPGQVVEALDIWLHNRGLAPPQGLRWQKYPGVGKRDAHLDYIRKVDSKRAAVRAHRLLAALQVSRAWAKSEQPLELSTLREWQALVLGEEAFLRTTTAFAKKGRERYRFPFQLELEKCLAEVEVDERTLPVRAALAYLDICFFHPFVDGNARLARLVMDAILWREGRALHSVEPIFMISRSATAPDAGWRLAHCVDFFLSEAP